MDLINRYVKEVVKQLPEDTREDVEKELKSNILDMLPEDYTDEDVRKVLTELGDPQKLSKEFRGAKRYLIGPDFYDNYLLVLKIVAIVLACVMPFVAVISAFSEAKTIALPDVLIDAFVKMIVLTIQAAFQAFAWITVVFAAIERAGVSACELPVSAKTWTVDDLKEVVWDKKKAINIADPIVSIIFSIAFLAVMYYSDVLIGWYRLKDNINGNDFSVIPLFNSEVISRFFPYMVILSAFIIAISILKVIYRQWNMKLAVVNLVYNLFSAVYVFSFFTCKGLISNEFINQVAAETDFSVTQVDSFVGKFVIGIAVLATIGIAVDTVEGFLKARK